MGAIRVQTPIPGPKSLSLMARREASVARGLYHATPIFISRASGAVIEDVDGNHFLDFAGGIGTLNVGHAAAGVQDAVKRQAEKFTHACAAVTPYEGYVRVAEKLNQATPGKFAKKTLLVNSGAEAIENAVKIARFATRRPAVICFEDAFHGRTLGTLSLTSKIQPYKDGFGPFISEFYRIPYAYCYRCSYQLKYPDCGVHCAHHLEDTFKRVVSADSVAAIVVEPVLGEGGFVVPPTEFFSILQDICRKHGIVFIADEVQTGFGRTGKLFACEHFGLEPDILVSAKSLGGGLPLAAVTGRAELMDMPGPGGLGSTYGGNPISCEAALAVFDEFEKKKLHERARHIGDTFQARAEKWKKEIPLVGDVRGLGAMRAIELVRDRSTREPAKEETNAVSKFAYEHGLITISAGTYGNVIRTLMPLVISDAELEEGMNVLEAALKAVSAAKASTVHA
ncbi:MAG: 4-aminobutyrate--2-oxoglutarate transaminase [Acidobacteria bacterium]|nr:4-aminobutyrate--2-oxoglutarate transaminase [Acidobacteriota bacterium]